MNKTRLDEILFYHALWLNSKGVKGKQANLRCAYLEGANLRDAGLEGADLRGANLRYANLEGADLRGADLRDADLIDANLECADLRDTGLEGADLEGANLRGTNLRGANLRGADLIGADLEGTNLRDADLIYTNLEYANLRGAKNIPFIPMSCPDKGSFIGYKKCGDYIVELEILDNSKRSSSTSRKCRCDKAKVLSITTLDGNDSFTDKISSNYDKNFIYKIGEIVEEPNFDMDRFNECAPGIHFFINREEAVKYIY